MRRSCKKARPTHPTHLIILCDRSDGAFGVVDLKTILLAIEVNSELIYLLLFRNFHRIALPCYTPG